MAESLCGNGTPEPVLWSLPRVVFDNALVGHTQAALKT
jgi:hypothetical protein